MKKEYHVELDEGVEKEHVIEVISESIEKAKLQHPDEAKKLEGIQIGAGKVFIQLAEGIPPELLIIITYTSPYTILAFKEIVIPLIQKNLKSKNIIEEQRKKLFKSLKFKNESWDL